MSMFLSASDLDKPATGFGARTGSGIAGSGAGGDILAGENVDPVSLGGLSAESREAVLERQRQIQLQKARERATGSSFTSARAVPQFSAPVDRPMSGGFGAAFGSSSSAHDSGFPTPSSAVVGAEGFPASSRYATSLGMSTSSVPMDGAGPSSGFGSRTLTSGAGSFSGSSPFGSVGGSAGTHMLADAMKERERRTMEEAHRVESATSAAAHKAREGLDSGEAVSSTVAPPTVHVGYAPAPIAAPAPAPTMAMAMGGGGGGGGGGYGGPGSSSSSASAGPMGGAGGPPSGGGSRRSSAGDEDDDREGLVMPAAGGSVDYAAVPRPVGVAALDLTDMRRFLTTPTPRAAGVVQCYIERDKPTFAWHPTFSLYMRDKDQFLLASKKRTGQRTSNYVISSDKRDLSRDGEGFMGKLRANFIGTEFIVYDDGLAPGDKESGSRRHELALVNYASNIMGSRGPRKMRVVVPRVNPADNSCFVVQPKDDSEEESMSGMLKSNTMTNLIQLMNKPPKWNDQVGAYVLNFNGRVTMASVKNFQLVTPDDHDTVILQFGRVGKDLFTMDYQWPLSPLQAFAICLSSFDYKLACE